MELLLIAFVALVASGLTLFSGFGLGTILVPVFALFFPLPFAIAATALVHFANNIFKFWLMAKQADWPVVARFSVPAAIAAIGGASLLGAVNRLPAIASYTVGASRLDVTPVKALVGSLIVIFAVLELWPRFHSMAFPPKWLPVGGALSGFFGGLSGNQGALRSAFLLRAGLSKEAFVATGVVSAVIVDATRLLVYGTTVLVEDLGKAQQLVLPVGVAMVAAFSGAVLGKRLLQKVTLRSVQIVVAVAMLGIGIGLIAGAI